VISFGRATRLLLTSTSMPVDEIVGRVRDLGGLCVPAHVDAAILQPVSKPRVCAA